MAGQIIKRGDKTWVVRIFMGRDSNGRRRYLNKTLRGTKKDANAYLSEALTKMSAGTFVEPVKLTVNQYLDKWIETAARPRLRERTLQDYSDKLKLHVRPALGRLKVADVRPLDIQRIYSAMLERGLGARTVRYTHAIISSAFKQAIKWRMLAFSPASAVELPRLERKEMQALSPVEAARFLRAAREDKQGVVLAFALTTGMRPEEYLAMQWKDIDLERGTATVRRSIAWRKGGGWYFGEPKTTRSRRTIPFPASMVRLLAEHRLRQAEARLKVGPDYENNDLVFATSEGQPLNLRNLTQRNFRPTLKRAGLPETFRLYDLRHTCATLLLAANEHPKVVSERLGHASITLTLDTYSHVLPSMQQAASEKLEAILFERKTGTL
jgi:integrase